ncbi:hypothetical protein Heshes_20110 [Alicyclobacillus hesperidum]|uniref:Fimbrial assembly protein (PilN) n=1 Tax=Alicyclobacillus hesperidum TaxID=89784 RepID=A0AA37TZD9_9BACL|nr:PilN domain-containing protein [Alicyclobacillus hesperidum]GLV14327.1 hypothetical protein Heshes_20110 [Alicyclobacillus hesperidum]
MDINLLPRPQKSHGNRLAAGGRGRLLVFGVVTLAAAACAALLVVLHEQVAQVATQVATLNGQVQTAERGSVPAHSGGASALQSELAQASAARVDWATVLQEIDAALVADMTVDEIKLAGSAMEIHGRSASVAEVAAFEQNLQKDPFAASVTFQVAKEPSQLPGQTPQAVFVGGGSNHYMYAYTVTLVMATGGTAQ